MIDNTIKQAYRKDGKGNILHRYGKYEYLMVQKLRRLRAYKTSAYGLLTQVCMLNSSGNSVQAIPIHSEIRMYIGWESNWKYSVKLLETSKLQYDLYTEQDCRYVIHNNYKIPEVPAQDKSYTGAMKALHAAFWARRTTK